jgi:signal transduction histidine kinase
MGNGNAAASSPALGDAPITRAAASFAHEINGPLESLLNLLFLLQGKPGLTRPGQHYLKLANEEVRRISEIAQEVLHQAGRAHATRQQTDVAALLDTVLDFYKLRLRSSRVTVMASHSGDDSVSAYDGHLRQALANLVRNAIDAMPTGGQLYARVADAHEWTGRKRRGVRVTIADTGSGICEAARANIFEPFFSTKRDGNGIGLSLVKDVVQEHEGLLRVRSRTQPGRSGTVFTMFLPRCA